jgi:hypothetical protein
MTVLPPRIVNAHQASWCVVDLRGDGTASRRALFACSQAGCIRLLVAAAWSARGALYLIRALTTHHPTMSCAFRPLYTPPRASRPVAMDRASCPSSHLLLRPTPGWLCSPPVRKDSASESSSRLGQMAQWYHRWLRRHHRPRRPVKSLGLTTTSVAQTQPSCVYVVAALGRFHTTKARSIVTTPSRIDSRLPLRIRYVCSLCNDCRACVEEQSEPWVAISLNLRMVTRVTTRTRELGWASVNGPKPLFAYAHERADGLCVRACSAVQ